MLGFTNAAPAYEGKRVWIDGRSIVAISEGLLATHIACRSGYDFEVKESFDAVQTLYRTWLEHGL
jgi:hypothetical protein